MPIVCVCAGWWIHTHYTLDKVLNIWLSGMKLVKIGGLETHKKSSFLKNEKSV